MTPAKREQLAEWEAFTEDMEDGAAFACLEQFDLTMDDVEAAAMERLAPKATA